jgi:hypothetical protein
MKLTIEVSPQALEFLDVQAIQDLVEKETKRLWHCRRSRELTPKERVLRDFIGRAAYKKLHPAEKERMLAGVELSE